LLYKKIFLRGAKVMFYSAQNINKKYPFPFNLIERFTFNNADYAYPCSKGAEEVLRAKGYKGQIKVVPLGLDEAETASNESEVFTIGFVGRLVEEKGILDLINALNQINRDYKLLIIGDGPLRQRIKRVIKFRSMEKKVELVGAVAREEMPSLYARMDILVAPSKTTARWKEQFGRMLTEAMMYGVAVIGSDSGSIPEVMAGCGVVFREGNVSKLKEAIFNLMNDEKARNEIIKRGREYALKHYTWDKTTDIIKDIYYELKS
jgi:glycosyltransferase involved in cell wall biosynthesis